MSIASEIEIYRTNLGNAYTACVDKESETIPENKNLVNLEAAIRGIPSGMQINGWAQDMIAGDYISKGDFVTFQDTYNFGDVSSIDIDSPSTYPLTTACLLSDNRVAIAWVGQETVDDTTSYSLYMQIFKWNGTALVENEYKTLITTLNSRPSYHRHLSIRKISDTRIVIFLTYSNTDSYSPMFFTVEIDGSHSSYVSHSYSSLDLSKGYVSDLWIENETDTQGWLFYSDSTSVYGIPVAITGEGTDGATATLITDLLPDRSMRQLKIMRYNKDTDGVGKWYLLTTYNEILYGVVLSGLENNATGTLTPDTRGYLKIDSGFTDMNLDNWLSSPTHPSTFGDYWYYWLSKDENSDYRDLRYATSLFQGSEGWNVVERPIIMPTIAGGIMTRINSYGIAFLNDYNKIFFLYNDETNGSYAVVYQIEYVSENYSRAFHTGELIELTQILDTFSASTTGGTKASYGSSIGFIGNIAENTMVVVFGSTIKIISITPPSNTVVTAYSSDIGKIYGVSAGDYAPGEIASTYRPFNELDLGEPTIE